MLVVHWAKHNATGRILKNGLRPQACWGKDRRGVFVSPFSTNATVNGHWRRTLKSERDRFGNYNGFVFRLLPTDFPVIAGDWLDTYATPKACWVQSLPELAQRFGVFWRGQEVDESERRARPAWRPFELWGGFELIVPHLIASSRILRVLRDRPPRNARREQSDHRHEIDEC